MSYFDKVKFWADHEGRYLIKKCKANSQKDFDEIKALLEAYGVRTAITDYNYIFEGSIVDSIRHVLEHADSTLAPNESLPMPEEPQSMPAAKTGKKR